MTRSSRVSQIVFSAAGKCVRGIPFLILAGMLIRVTTRDRFVLSAIPFYILPPAAMTLLAAFAFVFHPARRRIRLRLVMLLGLCMVWTWHQQWEFHPSAAKTVSTDQSLRLLMWNVYEGKFGWPEIVRIIQRENPEIIALAEVGSVKDSGSDFFARHFPDYEMYAMPRQLAILSRLPVHDLRREAWDTLGVYMACEVEHRGAALTVVFADVKSDPWLSRRQPMQTLTDIACAQTTATVLVGDWNTPVDSAFLDPLRSRFRSAFEECGNGLHVTWPMPMPVLAIDHVWGNASIAFHQTRILTTARSDHRPVVVDFTIRPD